MTGEAGPAGSLRIDPAVVDSARLIADEVLFPHALETDGADLLPVENLDALAADGFYGIFGPVELGGLGANGPTTAAALEAIAGGCLTTALVWGQHFALLGATIVGPDHLRHMWAEDLAAGRLRSGIAFGGLLPGPAILAAVRSDGGWILDGHAPWVSGWGRIDLLHVSARGPDETIVNLVIDAKAGPGLSVERQRLAVVDASATVHLSFDAVEVPDERVLSVQPFDPSASLGASLRMNGSLALGVAGRCLRLIGPSSLDDELGDLRAELDSASPEEMADRRAAASAFAYRAAGSLMTHVGSRSILRSEHAQRLAREAQFLLVFGSRPMIRASLLTRLARP